MPTSREHPVPHGGGPYRIVFMVNAFPTPSETFILNQITALLRRGHSIQIFARHPGTNVPVHSGVHEYSLLDKTTYLPTVPENYLIRALKIVSLTVGKGSRNLLHIPALLNFLRWKRQALSLKLLYAALPFLDSKSFDIVHAHFGQNGLASIALRRAGLFSSPVITSFHGYDVTRIPIELGSGFYEPLFSQGDAFTANSSFTLSKMTQLGCPPERSVILPVAVDPERFPYRDRSGRSQSKCRMLTVARLTEVKGLRYGIEAVAKLVKRGVSIQYDIVGEGELTEALLQHVADLGIEANVTLHGWKTQNEILPFYEDADIFVLPSVSTPGGEQEGQGSVLQEAQATGLPVVATRSGGISEGILEGESGFLVPEADPEALASQISTLVVSPELRRRMGDCGRGFIERSFSLERLTDKLESIYADTLEGWPSGTSGTM